MSIAVVVFVFGCLTLSLGAELNSSQIQTWERFKVLFSKKYETVEEHTRRQMIFMENREKVYQHFLKHVRGEVSYLIGINKFSDMTQEEVQSATKCLVLNSMADADVELHQQKDNVQIPEAVDWRTKGVVTPVKDQNPGCGSCWAFSAIGALEGQHALKTKKLVSLSEQNLVDCDTFDNGCNGGIPSKAFLYISKQGIDTEESYPYEAQEGTCRFNPNHIGATDKGSRMITSGDEKALKAAVGTVGPMSVLIDATDEGFYGYHSGIYQGENCSTDPWSATHAVLIVGYGTSPKGEDYWIVKNSEGAAWGDSGYIKMARNKNICGIANNATYPVV